MQPAALENHGFADPPDRAVFDPDEVGAHINVADAAHVRPRQADAAFQDDDVAGVRGDGVHQGDAVGAGPGQGVIRQIERAAERTVAVRPAQIPAEIRGDVSVAGQRQMTNGVLLGRTGIDDGPLSIHTGAGHRDMVIAGPETEEVQRRAVFDDGAARLAAQGAVVPQAQSAAGDGGGAGEIIGIAQRQRAAPGLEQIHGAAEPACAAQGVIRRAGHRHRSGTDRFQNLHGRRGAARLVQGHMIQIVEHIGAAGGRIVPGGADLEIPRIGIVVAHPGEVCRGAGNHQVDLSRGGGVDRSPVTGGLQPGNDDVRAAQQGPVIIDQPVLAAHGGAGEINLERDRGEIQVPVDHEQIVDLFAGGGFRGQVHFQGVTAVQIQGVGKHERAHRAGAARADDGIAVGDVSHHTAATLQDLPEGQRHSAPVRNIQHRPGFHRNDRGKPERGASRQRQGAFIDDDIAAAGIVAGQDPLAGTVFLDGGHIGGKARIRHLGLQRVVPRVRPGQNQSSRARAAGFQLSRIIQV